MTFELITKFDEPRVQQLCALYQDEWWSRDRSIEQVRRLVEHSDFLFGYRDPESNELMAFARVLSDRVFKALIFDVIVAPRCRGTGLGRTLIETILGHPILAGVKHVELYCLPDLVPFYRKLGFTDIVGGVLLMRRDGVR